MDDVWYVDDDVSVSRLAQILLSKNYDTVRTFSDGAAALKALQDGKRTKLIITDTQMHGLPGPDLIAAARKIDPALHFILVSAEPFLLIDNARKLKVAYASKPFTADFLKLAFSLVPPTKNS
jgi:DNA-binding NtrC family response regulator